MSLETTLLIIIIALIILSAVLLVLFVRARSIHVHSVKTHNYTFTSGGKEVTVRLTEAQYTGVTSLASMFQYTHGLEILREKSIEK